MASIISAGTTSGTALNFTGDTSGNLAFQTGAGANTITVPNTTGTLALTSQIPSVVTNGPAFAADTSNTSCTGSQVTTIIMTNKLFDTATAYSTSTGRFTPQVAGYYQFNAYFSFYGNTGVNGQSILIRKNGTSTIGAFGVTNADNNAWWTPTASAICYLNGSTDYVVLCSYFNGSSTFSLGNATFNGCFLRS